jgi:hypothetical protein
MSEVEKLESFTGVGPFITIYMPTHDTATPPNSNEDHIRLKNLMHQACDMLSTTERRKTESIIMASLDAMTTDASFWKSQTAGLMICMNTDMIACYNLPTDTEECVDVNNSQFYLAPIYGLLDDQQSYYVLALSQHEPMLFAEDGGNFSMIEAGLPDSLEAALNIDEAVLGREQQRSMGGSDSYNGRGGAKNQAEENRARYWKLIDTKIMARIDVSHAVLLAGTDSEIAEYREHSTHTKLVAKHIHGSFSKSQIPELAAASRQLIAHELTEPAHSKTVEDYSRIKGETQGARTIQDITKLQQAAKSGRIETLLVAMTRRTRDTIRGDSRPSTILSFPASELARRSIQMIASSVRQAGGRIVNIAVEAMPEPGTPALAILRY